MSVRVALAIFVMFTAFGAAFAQTLSPLVVVTETGEHRFSVELADSEAERARGLMFRRTMPQDRGMLFDFGSDQSISMWMQNTYLPLDMVFIRSDGTIARVVTNTIPFSTDLISSGEDVRAVLEVNAGVAKRISLSRGDRIEHPIFK